MQNYLHKLETQFLRCKQAGLVTNTEVSYFLNGLDACRTLLDGGTIRFSYEIEKTKEKAIAEIPTESVESALEATPEVPFTAYVIDDEPDLVTILSEVLVEAEFSVQGFSNSIEALAAVRQRRPDVVVTDMRMPGMTGLDILKKVWEIDSDLPVIFISGQLTKETVIEAVNYGVFGIIEKPFTESQVVTVCTAAAKKSQLNRLLSRAITLALYQFSALDSSRDEELTTSTKEEMQKRIKSELQTVLKARRALKSTSATRKI